MPREQLQLTHGKHLYEELCIEGYSKHKDENKKNPSIRKFINMDCVDNNSKCLDIFKRPIELCQ